MFTSKKTNKNEKGLTLVECLIAMVVTLVGTLAVFQLVALSVNIEQFAYRSTVATTLAVNKIEELKLGNPTNGGSLTSNVSGYSDTTNQLYTVRWQISSGAVGTKSVIMEVTPRGVVTQNAKIRIETLIR